MNIEKIFETLKKDFDFRDNEILILKALQEKDMTADEICKKTGIPKGRIYEFLNMLVEKQIAKKIQEKPAFYTAKNLKQNVYDFMKYNFDLLTNTEAEIINAIEDEETSEKIEMITNTDEYFVKLRKAIVEDDDFKMIERRLSIPFFFYPKDEIKFMELRKSIAKKRSISLKEENSQIFKKFYNEAFRKGKKFKYITTQQAIKLFFKTLRELYGKEVLINRINHILRGFKKYNVEVRVISDPITNFLMVSNQTIFMCLNIPDRIVGIKVKGKDIIKEYDKYFYNIYKDAMPAQYFLKKMLENLKMEKKR